MTSNDRHDLLKRLLDEHGDRLYATLARLTLRREAAAELLQELFLRLGRSSGFEQARDPAAYAFRVAINLAMEWHRKSRGQPVADALLPEMSSTDPSPLTRMIEAEELQRLLEGLSRLSDLARELFILRMIERQSYETIARRRGKTPHQVRGLCHAAVRQLRQTLAEDSSRCRSPQRRNS